MDVVVRVSGQGTPVELDLPGRTVRVLDCERWHERAPIGWWRVGGPDEAAGLDPDVEVWQVRGVDQAGDRDGDPDDEVVVQLCRTASGPATDPTWAVRSCSW